MSDRATISSRGAPAPAPDWALFLDADGVLLELVSRPNLVAPSAATLDALATCRDALGGALALVSGRRVEDLRTIFAPLDLACAGLHGLERGLPGAPVEDIGPADGGMRRAVAAAKAFAAGHPGVLVEDKGRTVAVHTRQARQHAAAVAHFADELVRDLGPDYGVLAGKDVHEVKPTAVNKGHAIAGLLALPPFAGRRPVFAGDDVTDEAGFATVNERDGISIRVGAPAAATAARWHCADVTSMIRWLASVPTRLNATSTGPREDGGE